MLVTNTHMDRAQTARASNMRVTQMATGLGALGSLLTSVAGVLSA